VIPYSISYLEYVFLKRPKNDDEGVIGISYGGNALPYQIRKVIEDACKMINLVGNTLYSATKLV